MGYAFESAIEKLGRILAAQYNIKVVFEGTQAKTDGKVIYLPYFNEMSDELKADLNGYLDHEVAHCKFTDFSEIKKVINRFHQELFNAVEDVRIEREMVAEFPGTAFNLGPLNEKCQKQWTDNWKEIPWPIRTIKSIRDIMEGRSPIMDEEIEKYIDLVKESAIQLRECKTTKEIRVLTEEIVKRIIDAREEEKQDDGEQEEGSDKDKKEGKGKGKGGKGKSSKGDKTKGEGDSSGEPSGDSDSSEEQDEADRDGGPKDKDGKGDEGKDKDDELLTEPTGREDSEYDKHIKDVHHLVNGEIEKELKASGRVKPSHKDNPAAPVWEGSLSVPVTTRFDKETDHSGKGSSAGYARLKREIMPLVQPIKQQLERILKVKENAKWTPERERGSLDPRGLSKLSSQPGYRTVFREYTKTETNNVAVEILVDMSGSMGYRMETAKKAVTAMAEALKDLQIPFEVTGFFSRPDANVANLTRSLGEDRKRFNRVAERLELHIFKSFDATSLTGIDELFVGEQNPDGECVVWAAKRLVQRREKRKILMVLSDGEPATGDSNRGILCSDLKNRVKQLRKSGIECIGVGIQTDAPKHFYPDYVVINNLEELPRTTMRKLSSLIAKGVK